VYANWNGDTEVSSWRVLTGQSTVATAARSGFETAIPVQTSATAFKVQALDSHGRVLGTSRGFNAT
jgi:hypothetical protein